MCLFARPVTHMARADITRENFLACHFSGAINPVFQNTLVTVPSSPRQQRLFEQGRESARPEWCQIHCNAADQARTKHLPTRWACHEAVAMLLQVRLRHGLL